MKKIILFIQALIILCFASVNAFSQSAKLTVSANSKTVALNSSIQVTYTLTGGNASKFIRPTFANFQILGQYQSSGGGMTVVVNGKLVQSGDEETKWTYQLVPTKTGKITIDPANAYVNNQWVSSPSIVIEAVNGTAKNNGNNNTGQQNTKTNPAASSGGEDIFIRAYADKQNPLQGEQILVTYKIYTRVNVSQFAINKLSAYAGFWSQDLLKEGDNAKQSTEVINGQNYTVAEIRKIALFPQKSGNLTVQPLEVECVAQVKTKSKSAGNIFDSFFNDPFFGNNFFDSYQNVKKKLKSNILNISVRPLPDNNKPNDFKNAVGSFTFNSSIDQTQVKANEPVNLKFTISGKGNLKLIDNLNIEFPPDLETYDPKTNDKIVSNAAGVSGSRTFEYLIIPRNSGQFKIKPVNFSYYDLNKRAYVTLTSPEYVLNVAKGAGGSNITTSGVNQEDVKYIGSDIRFSKTQNTKLEKIGSFFFGSGLFWALFLLPLLLFIAFIVIARKQLKLRSDVQLMKNKKATKVSMKRLKLAQQFLSENKKEAFLDEIFKALWGYLSDKLGIPVADLSKESVENALQLKNVNPETSKAFIETINNCEFARFAPADNSTVLADIYNEAFDIISKIEKELK
ncbi:MAG: protein BatD [Bacteroidetes bacterium]|nr:protein BatD [Bacteroidota bacterium]